MKYQTIEMDEIFFLHWCGHFSCSPDALLHAMAATQSNKVGVVAMYLVTRSKYLRGCTKQASLHRRPNELEYCMDLKSQ